jgi:cobalamin biosynthesis protein CobT
MNGGHKRGGIDSGSMWKGIVYNNTDTGRRVFKQREEDLNLDTAVTLLVDTSGSMGCSSKMDYANASAVVLNDVFAKVGVKCRVAGFTDNPRETISYVHKEFDERISREELASRLGAADVHYKGGNADGESVLWEYHKLMQRSEPKKILVVLSDGMPCDSKSIYNVTDHTKQVIKRIEQQGKVSIVGIGIVDKSVRHFYTRHHIVNDVTNIEEVLLNLLKNEVLHA